MKNKPDNKKEIISHVKQWLEKIVIGLSLCPFAEHPFRQQKIKYSICEGEKEEELIEKLIAECHFLSAHPEIETTLLICPNNVGDFFDFCQVLNWANTSIKRNGWQGIYQLAHFHPQYCFNGCEQNDAQNLTNRSPYPIFHILREESLERALTIVDAPETIPEKNIETMNKLSAEDRQRYFYYLYSH